MQPIDAVTIWNRTDCCVERLNGFVVLVLDANRREVARIANTPTPKESVRIDLGSGGANVKFGSALLWNQQFVPTANKDAGRALPIDGSAFIPANWPGGTNDFFRSAKGGPKKRQLLTLDLIGLPPEPLEVAQF